MYVRVEYPRFKAWDLDGEFAAGYYVYTYAAGTSNPATTYSNRALTAANTNPIVLNAYGEADIYVGVAIKLILTIPGGDPSSPLLPAMDYVGEQRTDLVSCDGIAISNNTYTATPIPALASLSNRLLFIWTPDTDSLSTIGAKTFTGTGIDDCLFSGGYLGTVAGLALYTVEIDAIGTPDTFRWRKGVGAWTAGVAITAAAQSLSEGVYVTFSETTNHTLGDLWTVDIEVPVRLNVSGLGSKLIYKNEGEALMPLEAKDLIAGIPATCVYSTTHLAWILNNPSDPALATVIPQRIRKNITAVYTVTTADTGKELSCNGTFAVTLPACAVSTSLFYYIKNEGTGTITINAAGADLIYWPFDTTGQTSITLTNGAVSDFDCIQLVTNGVDWHVLTAVGQVHGMEVFTADGNWTAPPGVQNVWVTGCAAGGGGAGADIGTAAFAGGGGSNGGFTVKQNLTVVPGTVYAIGIGTGGAGGVGGLGACPGDAGGDVTFDVLLTLTGGVGGVDSAGWVLTLTADSIAFGLNGQGGVFGDGGQGGIINDVGVAFCDGLVGTGYGAGGGGGAGINADAAGGAGTDGFLIVEW